MRHAARLALPPGALPVTVIEPSLVAGLVTSGGGAQLVSTGVTLADARTVAVATIAATAEEEDLAASAAADEPK